jgi:hypothetical protein
MAKLGGHSLKACWLATQARPVQTYHAAAGDVAADRSYRDATGAAQWNTVRPHGDSGSRSTLRSVRPSTEIFTLTETAARRLEKQLWTLQVQLQLSAWHLE